MLLYNSATRRRDEFVPNVEGKVSMYTCGPTVYHYAHIGNLRSYIMGHLSSDADTGEDKMLKGAKREKKTVMQIAEFYTNAFFEDCKKLNIKTPDVVAPATSCIDEFIKVIESLIEKGFAYEAGGNIYFDTSKLKQYYIFNDFREEDLEVGVREGVEEDGNKKNKADFVLWFTKSKFDDQELKWNSPWGVGYPGWHIECSCISMKYLGESLDIHCGGIDNAFPHHTNEIAQSEAYIGHKWCNYWFHVHHLNTNSGKMSKSKGEFLTVSLLESKGYNPLVYRLFCLQSHYRKSLVFSYENIDNAVTAYNKIIARALSLLKEDSGETDANAFEEYKAKFCAALDNDLNTALGVTAVYDVLKAKISPATKLALIEDFDKVLGLDIVPTAKKLLDEEKAAKAAAANDPFVAEIEDMIRQRAEAKKAKNYALADSIRQQLADKGVTLIDTPEGTKYKID